MNFEKDLDWLLDALNEGIKLKLNKDSIFKETWYGENDDSIIIEAVNLKAMKLYSDCTPENLLEIAILVMLLERNVIYKNAVASGEDK